MCGAGGGAGKVRVGWRGYGRRREHCWFSGCMGVPREGVWGRQWGTGQGGFLQDEDHLLLQAVEGLVEAGQHPLVVVVVVERGRLHGQHVLVVQGVELPEAAHVLLLRLIPLLVWGEKPWKTPTAAATSLVAHPHEQPARGTDTRRGRGGWRGGDEAGRVVPGQAGGPGQSHTSPCTGMLLNCSTVSQGCNPQFCPAPQGPGWAVPMPPTPGPLPGPGSGHP